jgi:hypothetical protein
MLTRRHFPFTLSCLRYVVHFHNFNWGITWFNLRLSILPDFGRKLSILDVIVHAENISYSVRGWTRIMIHFGINSDVHLPSGFSTDRLRP